MFNKNFIKILILSIFIVNALLFYNSINSISPHSSQTTNQKAISQILQKNNPLIPIQRNNNKYKIQVASKTFSNNSTNKSLVINGNNDVTNYSISGSGNKGSPYIIPNLNLSSLVINNTNVYFTVVNSQILGSVNGSALFLNNVTNAVFNNLTLNNFTTGITVEDSINITFNNSSLINGGNGIVAMNSKSIFIESSKIKDLAGTAISFINSTDSDVTNNNIIQNRDVGINMMNSTNIIIQNNLITNSNTGINIQNSSYDGFYLNNLTSNAVALYMTFSNDNSFSNNDFVYSTINNIILVNSNLNYFYNNSAETCWQYAFYIVYSNYNTFSSNTLNNNTNGFKLYASNFNNIIQNIDAEIYNDIIIQNSNTITIANNTITSYSGIGVDISSSSNIVIRGNIIKYCGGQGINLLQSSNITVTFGIFKSNSLGAITLTNYNLINIAHNVFIGNNFTDPFGNQVSYTTSGSIYLGYNFWSNQFSPDNNQDGVVDVVVNGDSHALTSPFLTGVWNDPSFILITIPYFFNYGSSNPYWANSPLDISYISFGLKSLQIYVDNKIYQNQSTNHITLDLSIGSHILCFKGIDVKKNTIYQNQTLKITDQVTYLTSTSLSSSSSSSIIPNSNSNSNSMTSLVFITLILITGLIALMIGIQYYNSNRKQAKTTQNKISNLNSAFNSQNLDNSINRSSNERSSITSQTVNTRPINTLFCYNCHKPIFTGDVFCQNCGKRIK